MGVTQTDFSEYGECKSKLIRLIEIGVVTREDAILFLGSSGDQKKRFDIGKTLLKFMTPKELQPLKKAYNLYGITFNTMCEVHNSDKTYRKDD